MADRFLFTARGSTDSLSTVLPSEEKAISFSLTKYIEDSQITAIDISEEALRVAKLNARNNEVEDKLAYWKYTCLPEFRKELEELKYVFRNKKTG